MSVRCFRLLVIAEPLHSPFHISSAEYDSDRLSLAHARHMGDSFPRDANAQAFAGYHLFKHGRLPEALVHARRGWVLASSRPRELTLAQTSFCALACSCVLRGLGALSEAIAVAEAGAVLTGDPDLRTYLSMLLVVAAHPDDAIRHLMVAVGTVGRAPWADLLLGTLLLESDKPRDAVAPLQLAAERFGESTQIRSVALNNLGVALAMAGDLDASVRAFRSIVGADADVARATRNAATVESREQQSLVIVNSEQVFATAADALVVMAMRSVAAAAA